MHDHPSSKVAFELMRSRLVCMNVYTKTRGGFVFTPCFSIRTTNEARSREEKKGQRVVRNNIMVVHVL